MIPFSNSIDLDIYSGSSPDIGRFEYISSECNLLGDINIDQNINIFDIILVVNCILDECFIQCGDINSDEDINILDIIYMVNFILENQ